MIVRTLLLSFILGVTLACGAEQAIEVMPAVSRGAGRHEAPGLLMVPTTARAAKLSTNRLAFTTPGREFCFHYRLSLDLGVTWLPGYEACIEPFTTGRKASPIMTITLADVGNVNRRMEVSATVKRGAITAPVSITWID